MSDILTADRGREYSQDWVRQVTRAGKLKAIKAGRDYLYLIDDLMDFIDRMDANDGRPPRKIYTRRSSE